MRYYKKRCSMLCCKKKAVEENEGAYLCKNHRSRKLDSNQKYPMKNGKYYVFIEGSA